MGHSYILDSFSGGMSWIFSWLISMADFKFSAIQFIGTQRSGSNLLRVMLNQLPEISAPHPPHILKTFFPILHLYGDLSKAWNFHKLVDDICEWVNKNPVPWENVHLNSVDIINLCEEQTLIEVFRRIYEYKASRENASYWSCKSMETVLYLNELERSKINPFYIHLYRDGRDVALSFLKAIVGPKHIYHLAKKWTEEQRLSLALKGTVPASRFISVKYEDLISVPEKTLSEVCRKLGVVYREEIVMHYYESKESFNTASSGEMWKNVAKPILKNNHHKYLSELSREDLVIFESVAGDMLEVLSYECLVEESLRVSFTQNEIESFNLENKKRMIQASLYVDKSDLDRRRPQEELYNRILEQTVKS
jgi:hypothetical protein